MRRIIKNNMHPWKMVAAFVIPVSFFVISCHDQVGAPIAGEQTSQQHATEIYSEADESARPQGGFEAFYRHLRQNIMYPAVSRANHKFGKVLLRFVINEDGSLSDIEVLETPDEALGAEAIRVLSLKSEWTPAKKGGVAVKQRLVFPILFKLDFPGMEKNQEQRNFNRAIGPEPSLREIVVVAYATK